MLLSLLKALHLTNGFGLCSAHGSLWQKDDVFKPLERRLSSLELAAASDSSVLNSYFRHFTIKLKKQCFPWAEVVACFLLIISCSANSYALKRYYDLCASEHI